jgi:uncharacterized membrane protein YkoI
MRTPRGRTSRALSITAAGLAAGVLALGTAGCSGGGDDTATEASDGASTSDGGGGGDTGGPGIVGSSDEGGKGDDHGKSSAEEGKGAAAPSDIMAADANLRISDPAVDAEHALKTAKDKVGEDGTVHAIELEYDKDAKAWQWDVKILVDGTDHKVTVDATNGKVVDDDKESTDDDEKAVDLKDPMSYDDALAKASEKQDGALNSWKLEYDDGKVQYQFDIVDGDDEVEVSVDVDSGEVTQDKD